MFPIQKKNQGNLSTQVANPLDRFQRQMDRLWDSWLAPLGLDFGQTRLWDLDVTENDKEIVVRAETPGFEEKELDVQLANDVLTIRAQKDQKEGGGERFESFTRSVMLPHGIDAAKAQATYRNGVLELHLPRPNGTGGTRIPIQGRTAPIEATANPAAPAESK